MPVTAFERKENLLSIVQFQHHLFIEMPSTILKPKTHGKGIYFPSDNRFLWVVADKMGIAWFLTGNENRLIAQINKMLDHLIVYIHRLHFTHIITQWIKYKIMYGITKGEFRERAWVSLSIGKTDETNKEATDECKTYQKIVLSNLIEFQLILKKRSVQAWRFTKNDFNFSLFLKYGYK